MGYATEASFVQTFVRALATPTQAFTVAAYGREFSNGTSSRPDVIAVCVSGDVIAVEAKLERWRQALQQAYRNTFFVDRSYVLLPEPTATRALEYIDDFIARGVGLCTIIRGQIHVLAPAPKLEPHNVYRRELAREHALTRKRSNRYTP